MLMLVANRMAQHYTKDIVATESKKRWHLKCKQRWYLKCKTKVAFEMQKSHLPSLDETSPTTLPPIMPPMQKMATTKDQMKVTEVSHAVFRDSHSSRASLPSCEKRDFFYRDVLIK